VSVAPTDLLANERTFLAYIRTALALQAAGLAVFQFLDVAHHVLRPLLGLLLVGIGSYVAVAGYLRYRTNEHNLRTGAEVTSTSSPMVISVAVIAVPLVSAVILAVT
jgi:putative membrane protein